MTWRRRSRGIKANDSSHNNKPNNKKTRASFRRRRLAPHHSITRAALSYTRRLLFGQMWAVWATFLASFLPSSSAAAAWCSDGGDNCTCAQGSALPQYHITGLSGGAHDVNAILRWQGLTHVFHQRDGGWGHLVSADMQRWRRLPDALTDGAWDGGLAIIPDADGQPTPTILFDCTSVANCRPPGADGQPNGCPHCSANGEPHLQSNSSTD